VANKGNDRGGGRPQHLRPVPDPEELTVVLDLSPLEVIESIYANLAHEIGRSRDPLEVECGIAEWLSMTTEMVTPGVPADEGDTALAELLGALIDVARRDATTQALAVLRALSVLVGTPVAEVADVAAADLASSGVADRGWVAKIGQLRPTTCVRYGNVDGSQESLIAGFSYGRPEHAIVVLIDHDLGGGIKDCWFTDQPEMIRQQIMTTAALDPMIEVGTIDWVRGERILSGALSQPICAETDDQVSGVTANVPLLRRRVDLLAGVAWQPSGQRRRPARPAPAGQDELFDLTPSTAAAPPVVARRPEPGPAAAPQPRRSGASLQLKVTLAGSKPPIWRRLTVPESITLERLHGVIQIAFGWTDSHLHLFEVDGVEYGPRGEWSDARSERVRLDRLVAVGERFGYVYDFGDDWRHTIQLEQRIPVGPGDSRPRCIAGRRAGPPEDCGGIYGYRGLLEAITDPDQADAEFLGWAADALGTTTAQLGAYDPARFDLDEINAALLELRP
jgi:hypothetical protein